MIPTTTRRYVSHTGALRGGSPADQYPIATRTESVERGHVRGYVTIQSCPVG